MTATKRLDLYQEALNRGYNPEQRLINLLQTVLNDFSVDRAWLAYPCDPNVPFYQVPLEVTTPDYLSAAEVGAVLPVTPLVQDVIKEVSEHQEALAFQSDSNMVKELHLFKVRSMLLRVVTPGFGSPWMFGIHQCSYERFWENHEINIFTEIAKQIEDVLASYLVFQELLQSEKQYRALFDHNHNGLIIFDLDRKMLEVNRSYCEIIGYSADEILNFPFQRTVHPDCQVVVEAFFSAMFSGRSYKNEAKLIHRQGHTVDVEIFASIIEYQGERVALMAVQDISSRKKAERLREKALAVQSAILEATVDGILVVDLNRKVIRYNRKYVDIWKIPEPILKTMDAYQYLAKASEQMEDPAKLVSQVNAIYDQPQMGSDSIMQFKNGHVIEINSSPFKDGDEILGRVWSFRDITDAHKLNENLNYQANHDPLTGLINRREFERCLELRLLESKTLKDEHVVCYLDLDQFKLVNDSCGHASGDELLKQLSQLMKSKISDQDILARLGGDEFGLLLSDCDIDQAIEAAHTLRKAIAEYVFCCDQRHFNIAVSIGLAPINKTVSSVKDLLILADAACYTAKSQGRNRIHVHRSDDDVITFHQQEMDRVALIQNALISNRFKLWGQSINHVSGKTSGIHLEILLRLEDDEKQVLPPGAFLPTAERYNLASRVDFWVIENALQWFASHPEYLNQLKILAINLSGQSLGDTNILAFIMDILETSGFPGSKLCFEITETAAISNLNAARQLIIDLKSEGCLFALDDFGSGLSSFAYLKNLPVDFLKIDGQFICDLVSDPIDYAMVKSINEIGHVMGKETIAEYVESDKTLAYLRKLGVDYVQGYYLGKPMPLETVFRQK